MKRILLSVLAAASLFTATAAEGTVEAAAPKTSGKIVMEARKSNMEFSTVKVSRGIRLVIDDRTEGNIIVRAGENVMPYVELSVKNGVFTATISDKITKLRDGYCAEVHIPHNAAVNRIAALGASSVTVKPVLSATELHLSAAGASKIEAKADVTGEAEISCIGASSITLALTVTECKVDITGVATATLSGSARKCDIEVVGASKLNAADFKCTEIDAEVTGASTITVAGTDCDIEALGASKATVYCDGRLEAEAAGASTILYTGNCTVAKASNVGASTIKKQ